MQPCDALMSPQATVQIWRQFMGEVRSKREAALAAAEASAMSLGRRMRMQWAVLQWQQGTCTSLQEKQR